MMRDDETYKRDVTVRHSLYISPGRDRHLRSSRPIIQPSFLLPARLVLRRLFSGQDENDPSAGAAGHLLCHRVAGALSGLLGGVWCRIPRCSSKTTPGSAIKCYQCNLEVSYFSSWDWSAQCKLTDCPAGEQCSITKDQSAYQVGCKAGCKEDANTKCCDADGCNNWLNVGEDADAWKKVEAIKAACSPSSNDPKDCLNAIDPNLISGGGGLAGALGLPLVLAISVIVLVVLG
ncbi:uncharacterized protein LOC129187880 [Dunckerocampus dactyliophorus]|uniref:uncharacterized protein LOC129187880 n=1 Tax=Dunckerocampus dactyliophorus TaxID=161453 RepID=UPI0024066815|nr:uncharacterized protein LOC129187880 [Dunckerocampus dactyliophorus]XP_054643632.1 uncharacterized protein LOC129187880 [Dunckerocampus dactyliophorus]